MRKTRSLNWVEDFSTIRTPEIGKIILKLGNASRFIGESNQFFIAGAKGLGKTLLLVDKRFDIQNKHHEERDNKSTYNVHFIPSGEPFLDVMGGERNVANAEKSFLADLNNAKKAWSFSLKLSLFSYRLPSFFDEETKVKVFREQLLELTGERASNPTDIFRGLFAFMEISQIHNLIDNIDPVLERDLPLVRDANYIFIDGIDQSLAQLSGPAWINCQAGLIEAAFDLMRSNQHVKVYASIRIEAFANYSSQVKANVNSCTTQLFYDSSELKKILDHLAMFYEGQSTLEDFFGYSKIKKAGKGVTEDAFNYLIRHTLNTPRELVHICRGISSSKDNKYDEQRFRQVVNELSSNHLPNIFRELQPILKTLTDESEIDRFLGIMEKNIVSKEELIRLSSKHCGVDLNHHFHSTLDNNPFLDLYNCGLLGYIDTSNGGPSQRFHLPSSPTRKSNSSIPDSEFYFMHPALQDRIKNQNSSYRIIASIVIGRGYKWHDWNQYLLEIDSYCNKKDDPSFSSKVNSLISFALSNYDNGLPMDTKKSILSEFEQVIGNEPNELDYLVNSFVNLMTT